ncbi:Uncharacterised protein [Prevotella disiens]|uniref:Uncharacterized protein n=1 Tax=Prevotella disiens TaxID=28130 RepID=A0A379DZT2_9BACT|nr:Uncharacterised protein [Prevotella disiens]
MRNVINHAPTKGKVHPKKEKQYAHIKNDNKRCSILPNISP